MQCSRLNGTVPSTVPSLCNCVKTYFWTGSNCEPCSDLEKSTPNFNVTNCSCKKDFHWNFTEKICVDDIKCDGIPYSNGSIGGVSCNCFKGFAWS